ncbi:tubulin-tyrosine ligase family-domain-containing protein [Lipomyces arxii]|uniref:tubulin-tyrosine ligase family-domain-containing protein n=1 Tax=Lipomyces arxii TaxID=56418 RepID=UPI0034CF33AE
MHILVTNDDGPPGPDSPFVHYFIEALKKYTDWDISVALPSSQKSWISKAHVIGETISASFVSPNEAGGGYEGPYDVPRGQGEEWALLNCTPASCTQVGIFHLFKEKGPVDLVISGPNYGRNSTALFILSSGTVGAAMEGALCGVPSIGLSFAYNSRDLVIDQIIASCSISVKLIKHLYSTWPQDGSVDLYSINIPLAEARDDMIIEYTHVLANRWGSAFEHIEEDSEAEKSGKLQFKWKPDLAAVNASSKSSTPEGNDGYAVSRGVASVTPLKANFQSVPELKGEIKLLPPFTAAISYPHDSYVYPLLKSNLERYVPTARIVDSVSKADAKIFHFTEYEDLDFDRIMEDKNYLACSYIFRKALIRKHFLSHSVATYTTKHKDSILATRFPESYSLELDYAEYLDEALDDIYEFRDELETEQSWWILKPSMSDRGQGIRLFHTMNELRDIFEEFGDDSSDEQDNDDDDVNGVVTSQLRIFVIQKYLSTPLLLPAHGMRKFHIRTYVVASGAIKISVYKDMLALFALKPYSAPGENADLTAHLTNTCLQGDARDDGSVAPFWGVQGVDHENVLAQICALTAETFRAALGLGRVHFQPLPNAFEVYGFDYLVDSGQNVSLLEVNAYPDFAQTGDELKSIVDGLFGSIVTDMVAPYFDVVPERQEPSRLETVLEQDISGHW